MCLSHLMDYVNGHRYLRRWLFPLLRFRPLTMTHRSIPFWEFSLSYQISDFTQSSSGSGPLQTKRVEKSRETIKGTLKRKLFLVYVVSKIPPQYQPWMQWRIFKPVDDLYLSRIKTPFNNHYYIHLLRNCDSKYSTRYFRLPLLVLT